MARNLDLTALRSFVAVAETGGVTRAAGVLHLTQSAVSMQLKRLEESMGISLLDRSQRSVSLTASGEQLLGYARQMLALNDEVLSRLMSCEYEGEISLAVPHDIVYPAIPHVLQRFNSEFPRMRVTLQSSNTREIKAMFAQGKVDVALTTEPGDVPGAETLLNNELVWVGAEGGSAWRQRPLKLAFENSCIFRAEVQRALDGAGIAWDMVVESESTRTIEASVSADLAVHAVLAGHAPPYLEVINHSCHLPDLPAFNVNMYTSDATNNTPLAALISMLKDTFDSYSQGVTTTLPVEARRRMRSSASLA